MSNIRFLQKNIYQALNRNLPKFYISYSEKNDSKNNIIYFYFKNIQNYNFQNLSITDLKINFSIRMHNSNIEDLMHIRNKIQNLLYRLYSLEEIEIIKLNIDHKDIAELENNILSNQFIVNIEYINNESNDE